MKPRPLFLRLPPNARRTHLTVGEVAAQLQHLGYDCSTSLIRKLEREGLLTPPGRSEGNYRLLDEEAVARLRTILGLRDLGFSLEETAQIITVVTRPGRRADRDQTLSAIEDRIALRIRQMQTLRKALQELQHS
jgi:DNA-binding transcriptional MerR regulator